MKLSCVAGTYFAELPKYNTADSFMKCGAISKLWKLNLVYLLFKILSLRSKSLNT